MFEEIREIICNQLNIDKSFVYPDTNLIKSLEVDSLNLMEIILAIEDKYQVDFDEDAIEHISTVDDIIKHIKNE